MKDYYQGNPELYARPDYSGPMRTNVHKIHNSALAEVLENKFSIRLSSEQVGQVNTHLESFSKEILKEDRRAKDEENEPNKRLILQNYKDLVKKILETCNLDETPENYKQFGISDSGYLESKEPFIAILKQVGCNRLIIEEGIQTPLMSYFLTLEKQVEFSPAELQTSFNNARNKAKFISDLKAQKGEEHSNQCQALGDKITDEHFKQLKKIQLNHIEASLKEVHQKMKDRILPQFERFKFLDNLNPIHIYNPTFRAVARDRYAEMKKHYETLRDDNNLIIDQIKHRRDELKLLLKEINEINPAEGTSDKSKNTLKRNLENELKQVEKALEFHEKIDQKLTNPSTGILPTLDDAQNSKKAYQLDSGSTSRSLMLRSEPSSQDKYHPTSENFSPYLEVTVDPSKLVLSERTVPDDHVEVVEVKRQDKSTVMGGRFSIDLLTPAHMSVKEGNVSKVSGVRIQMINSPKLPPNPTKEEKELFRITNIELDMKMAKELIANMDAPPTKDRPVRINATEEHMEYLWTALVILGANNPQFKFGPEAIQLNRLGTCEFKPEKSVIPFFGGYKKTDLYHEMKEKHKDVIESLKLITEAKFGADPKKKKDIDDTAKKMASCENIKFNVQTFRSNAEKEKKDTPLVSEQDDPGPSNSFN